MKKALYGLLGLILLNLPFNSLGQNKNQKTYEYNIYLASKDIGDAKYEKNKIDLNIDWILKKRLTLMKNENNYSEYLESGNSFEKFFYERTDSVRLEDYLYYYKGKINNSLKRKDKIKQLQKGYEKSTLFGIEVFDYFNGDSIPKIVETQVFGDFYSFILDENFGVKKIKDNLFRVKYNILVNPKTNSDEFRINEPIQVDLKKKNNEYHIFCAKVYGETKFLFWIPLSISISEK